MSSCVTVKPSQLRSSPSSSTRIEYGSFAIPLPTFARSNAPRSKYEKLPDGELQEFIAFVKAKPGALNFGSGGAGTSNHLAGELFNIVTGARLVHVPYKGVNLAMQDVLAGNVHLVFIGIPAAAPHIKAGKLRALAIVAPQRSTALPDVPTVAEAGLKDFEVTTWYGILAPAGTPQPVVRRLNAELVKVMHAPEMKEKLTATGTEPLTSTPEEFAAYIKREIAKWGDVIRKAGVKAD